jgi:signal transduction histidine kinase
LRELVRDTIDRFKPQAAAREISLTADFSNVPLLAHIDADRIEQVLVNLMDNAIKQSPVGENVRVLGQFANLASGDAYGPLLDHKFTTKGSDKWIIISVADAGGGISPSDLPHIFDRFFRADHSRSRDLGGSGLGLSIAKAIIEAHGGIIWLESPPQSEIPSKGTVAYFALPAS